MNVNPMIQKIENAKRFRQEWESVFHSKELYDFYEARQYKNVVPDENTPYILNLIYTTIEEMKAKLLIKKPTFTLEILPGMQHWNFDQAAKSAQNKEDLLNAIILRIAPRYAKEIKRCFVDSQFAFGIFETGYGDGFQNPASPAYIQTDADTEMGESTELAEAEIEAATDGNIAIDDFLYFRRIKHWRFLVSDTTAEDLENCEWCGYYSYVNKEVLRNSEYWKNRIPLDAYVDGSPYEANYTIQGGDGSKVSRGFKLWTIWNNITKTKELHLNNGPKIYEEEFEKLKIRDLRWSERSRGFYPVPPVFMWIPSQNEMNNSRQMMKSNRQKAITRWVYLENSIDQDKVRDFLSATDQSLTPVKSMNNIIALNNPTNGQPIKEAFIMSQADFNKVAGVSNNEQGVADRTTATEAKIIADSASARESDTQEELGNFYSSTAKDILKTAIENISVPVMSKLSGVPAQAFLMDMQPRPEFGEITPSTLNDGFDFAVSINPSTGSVFNMQAGEQSFLKFLSIVSQFPWIAFDPVLISEAAFRSGYKNMQVISRMQQAAAMNMAAQGSSGNQQSGAGTGENGNNMAKKQIANSQPNDTEQVRAQLDSQMG